VLTGLVWVPVVTTPWFFLINLVFGGVVVFGMARSANVEKLPAPKV
jgi:hypothetical protein